MSYLNNYGTRNRKFQEGGEMAPAAPMGPEAGPEAGGGGEEEQMIALAEAAAQGDEAAATQLGMMIAPLILQEAQAQMGGGAEGGAAPAGPEGGAPVFRTGGQFAGRL